MFDREEIFARFPELEGCREVMDRALEILISAVEGGGKILLCGNGGSASDCDHIAGECLKGFLKKRPLRLEDIAAFGEDAPVAAVLQQGIPAISLPNFAAPLSAVCNDTDPVLIYAQLTWALAKPGDVLLGLSTSGKARNVCLAAKAAKQKGARVISLTGRAESPLSALADAAIRVPVQETYRVQEYHLPVYHWLCALLEQHFYEV